MAAPSARPSPGRYNLRDSRAPANGVATRPYSRNVPLGRVAVLDPNRLPGDPPRRIQATVNRRVDLLEDELAHKRISDAAFNEGRRMQATFEAAEGVRAQESAGKIDGGNRALARERMMHARIEAARDVRDLMEKASVLVGRVVAQQLRRVIAEGWRWRDLLTAEGKQPTRRNIADVAGRCREALETLARAQQT